VATVERTRARADRRASRILTALGDEFREARLGAGLSQQQIADAVETSRARYGRIEAGAVGLLSIAQASRIAAILGLDLTCRVYPNGDALRDAAQVGKLELLAAAVSRPLRWRTEVPLPALPDRTELRSWDASVELEGHSTRVEVEMRIRDGQALARRIGLKRRDDPNGGLLLVIADTDRNRRVLALHPDLFPDLPRLRPSGVFEFLRAGRLPPSGLVVL
jgi:transcriptional regulator with XRE-family HTH domain